MSDSGLAYHIMMLDKGGYDPVIVLLFIRTVLSLAIAVIFFIEPRKCGGKNRTVHWLLATVFAIGAWSAIDRGLARMDSIAKAGGLLPAGTIFWSELAIVIAEVTLVAVMVYQEFNAKTKQSFNLQYRCDYCEYEGECNKKS